MRHLQGRVSAFAFSKDFKTLIAGAKDGQVAFYNAHENFKLIALMDAHKDMGVPRRMSLKLML